MKVRYEMNNSGGGLWMENEDWIALELAGWTVLWGDSDNRCASLAEAVAKGSDFLGSYAWEAYKDFPSVDDAIAEWESITGKDADEEGCSCCGRPHYFWGEDV